MRIPARPAIRRAAAPVLNASTAPCFGPCSTEETSKDQEAMNSVQQKMIEWREIRPQAGDARVRASREAVLN